MAKLITRDVGLMILVALSTAYLIPPMFGHPGASPLIYVGVMMGMAFMALYAMVVMGGRHMPAKVRVWVGLAALVIFYVRFLQVGQAGMPLTAPVVSPALYCLLLAAVAAWHARAGERLAEVGWVFYAYGFPLLAVVYLLVPLLGATGEVPAMAVQAGAQYMALRGLVRIFWPSAAEGAETTRPLVYRPVPDAVVGLVERTAHRRARPFYTGEGGKETEGAISILCGPEEVTGLVQKLTETLRERPVSVASGMAVGDKVEVVIGPRR